MKAGGHTPSDEEKDDFGAETTERSGSQLSEGEDSVTRAVDGDQPIKPKKWWSSVKEPGSALQIIIAAAIALSIGFGVGSSNDVPDAAITLLAIPGTLWLRALTCTGKLDAETDRDRADVLDQSSLSLWSP